MMIVERIMREHGGHITLNRGKKRAQPSRCSFLSNIDEQGYSSKFEPHIQVALDAKGVI